MINKTNSSFFDLDLDSNTNPEEAYGHHRNLSVFTGLELNRLEVSYLRNIQINNRSQTLNNAVQEYEAKGYLVIPPTANDLSHSLFNNFDEFLGNENYFVAANLKN